MATFAALCKLYGRHSGLHGTAAAGLSMPAGAWRSVGAASSSLLIARANLVAIPDTLNRSENGMKVRFLSSNAKTASSGPNDDNKNESEKSSTDDTNNAKPSGVKTDDSDLYKDQNATWADRNLPESMLPYAKLARVDRPIGTYLLLLPGLWSIGMAAENGHMPDLKLMALFGIGAFVMRGAGCTINDFWDRDIDGKVKRTSQRPLASGKVSPAQAIMFLAAQCTVGLGVLVQMNHFTIALGAASLVPVALYPLAKRVTGWPQAVLGLTFNWGALLGWAAVHGSLDLTVTGPLYIGGAFWTLMYDTIYAHQDKDDDRALGLRSSALTIGDKNAKPVLAGFGAAAIGLWAIAGMNAGLGESPLYWAALAGSGAHFAWQIGTADLHDRMNLTNRFVSNQTVGLIMLTGIVGGKLML